MHRLNLVEPDKAEPEAKALLDAIQRKMGLTPNIMRAMANSPAVLRAYSEFSGALAEGALPARLREQIALQVAELNECGYCLAAHSVIAKQAGLSQAEIVASRRGKGTGPREDAALVFARTLVERKGEVTDADVEALREAGFSDGEIAEITANVVLNILTNYINHVAKTPIDFPRADPLP